MWKAKKNKSAVSKEADLSLEMFCGPLDCIMDKALRLN